MPAAARHAVTRSKAVLGGTPVFAGTRVPVDTLLDYIEAGDRLDDFLADFPTVTRERALAVLRRARQSIVADARPAR